MSQAEQPEPEQPAGAALPGNARGGGGSEEDDDDLMIDAEVEVEYEDVVDISVSGGRD
jgi:hypothetical protein